MRLSIAILVLASVAGAREHRFDCETLARISSTTFEPGDVILLKRGIRCSGPLAPKGSGAPGRPIRLGAYGEGPLPIIDGGKAEAALRLADQEHWDIENLELTGGDPFGIEITATAARRHFVLRNVVVHGTGGTAKKKASGLVVVTGPVEDVLIDGVTAYDTKQWAGIYVSGSATARARDVVVRNSIVHDVDGDGIVLFRTENGRIEKSVAWRTGMQERETIGTPNGIWTWTCRHCVVENTEGFWIDSPGVDGGVYDIDWGNEDNVVQFNYAHDAMGYCAAIFGAGKLVTTDSVIRDNVCVNNGRSPKLARRQGDIYTSTWEGGALDGIRIERNVIVWNPPVDAPAIQMSGTEFTGSRPNVVAENRIWSSVASLVRAAPPVKFERNTYWRPGGARWSYGGREYAGIEEWKAAAPADLFGRPEWPWRFASAAGGQGKWRLALRAGTAADAARSQFVFVQAALAQYGALDATVEGGGEVADWNLGRVRRVPRTRGSALLVLTAPDGKVARQWDEFVRPAELGLALKHYLGPAPGNAPVNLEGTLP